jgi:hypothetical protein
MTMPFTLDNHFIFGYNDKPFSVKENYFLDKFFCEYSRCSRQPGNFKEECINTAKEVAEQAALLGRKPYVFLSGGLDSEVVAKAFIDAGIDFEAISFRFKYGFSSHEVFYIDQFIEQNNLKHTFYDIDPVWLQSNEASDFCKQSTCIRAEMLPHMKLIKHVWDNLNGLPILGNGDLYVSKEINKHWLLKDRSLPKYEWRYIEYEYIVAWFRFAIANNILGALAFFQHNPYIVLAMIQEPEIQKCINDEYQYKLTTRSTKPAVYRKYWPDLIPRMKYHGGEKIGSMCVEINRRLSNLYASNGKWSMPVDLFEKSLRPIND